jgi:hypothetical protein
VEDVLRPVGGYDLLAILGFLSLGMIMEETFLPEVAVVPSGGTVTDVRRDG